MFDLTSKIPLARRHPDGSSPGGEGGVLRSGLMRAADCAVHVGWRPMCTTSELVGAGCIILELGCSAKCDAKKEDKPNKRAKKKKVVKRGSKRTKKEKSSTTMLKKKKTSTKILEKRQR